jgi:hypothetical protein
MPRPAIHTLLLIQTASTFSMCGLIWFVQIVHYPLFERVGAAGFADYEAMHATRTGWVVGPLMVAELITAILLLLPSLRPATISTAAAGLGAGLVGVIWISTALIQVPLHDLLSRGYDPAAAARLVSTNWIRTIAWTARGVLVLVWLDRLLLP